MSDPHQTAVPHLSAFFDRRSHVRLWLVAVVGLGFDLWSKHWAFSALNPSPRPDAAYVAIEGLLSFRRSLNPGALFGLGKGLTPVFIGASLLALGFVLYLFYHSTPARKSLHIALACVLAGAIGKLYDRAFMLADVVHYTEQTRTDMIVGKLVEQPGGAARIMSWPDGIHLLKELRPGTEYSVRTQGVVRDFVKFDPHVTIRGMVVDLWPWIFNIADVLLVVGVGLLLINFWYERKAEVRAKADAGSESAPDAAAAERQ